MRKALILMICMLATSMMWAQSRTSLKGPKAKHYKPWKQETTATPVYTDETMEWQGPKAKNERLHKVDAIPEVQFLARTERRHLKGLKAKHYKPWQDRQSPRSDADGMLAADDRD